MIDTEMEGVNALDCERKPFAAARLQQIARMFEAASNSAFPEEIEAAARLLGAAFNNGRKLLIFGNGGSAADAQHLCGELVIRFQTERRALPAVALTADSAVLTACGNDFCYERVFARQIEALGQPGDVALGISTSGSSPNVVQALQVARKLGLKTMLLTGSRAGMAAQFSDLVMAAPAGTTARVQELHLAAYHLICEFLDNLFTETSL